MQTHIVYICLENELKYRTITIMRGGLCLFVNGLFGPWIAWPQALSLRKTTITGQTISLILSPFLAQTDSPIREVDTFRIKKKCNKCFVK